MLYFDRWKTVLIWLTVLVAFLLALPNVLPRSVLQDLPEDIPARSMTLGLDLQGGSSILLQVDRQDILNERLRAVRDDVREALRQARIGYTGLSADGQTVEVNVRDESQIAAAREALQSLTEPVSSGIMGGGLVNEVELSEPQNGLLRLQLTDQGIDYRVSDAVSQSIEVVNRRVNELGTTEPSIQRQGQDRILVQVPGLEDPERLKELIGQTARLTFQLVDESMSPQQAVEQGAPPGSTVLYSEDEFGRRPILVEDRAIISGENLRSARATLDQQEGQWVVAFTFDNQGAVRFGQVTTQNVGRPFAIVLDDNVISAPVIRSPITGGSGIITGNFNPQDAQDLAVLLTAGALPADLTVVEERTVGPGLGQDSIEAGSLAAIIGAVAVLVFMLAVYGTFGVIANIALLINIIMIVALLSITGATLTLPGIAGIVLTVGMAVDSNVLIFERIREERAGGRKLIDSIDTGFQRALATIVDANITTLIAAVILFFLGTGPVRGFAVTLGIGIVTTVFTAFTLTRWMMAFWLRKRRPKELPRAPITLVPQGTRIKFMWLRRVTFSISAVASMIAITLFLAVNMNFGIDFRGGTLMEVQSRQGDANVGEIRSALSQYDLGEIQVQEFGTPQDVLIRVGTQAGGDEAQQQVISDARSALESDYDFRRVEVVGPTVSAELAFWGTIGVLAALVAILFYIWVRFEWQFAVGAILATLHDVVLTIGFFVITQIEFNLSSIAAILTIVGYSLNDTVVVYDRIRENLRRYRKLNLSAVLDQSMNETLSRTVMTSMTTLVALGALFFFGGEVIRSFTAAMLFGVAIGTYSSIFVASPLLILFKLRAQPVTSDATAAGETKPQTA